MTAVGWQGLPLSAPADADHVPRSAATTQPGSRWNGLGGRNPDETLVAYCGPVYSYRDGRMWAVTR